MALGVLEAAAKTWEMFPGAIQAAAQELVIAITGQSSSTEITQGQDTGATLHGQVRQDLIDADAQTLSTCLRERCLRDYAALNFGDAELAPWPRWKTDPPANAKARGEAMSSLGAGIEALDRVAPEGKRVDRRAVLEAHGIPLEDRPEPAPVAPAPAPPAPQEPPAP
jgi:phage gp29-like protein